MKSALCKFGGELRQVQPIPIYIAMWPLFRPILAVLSMLLMALTIPVSLLNQGLVEMQLLGVTYYFTHEGNSAYVWACYDDFSQVLCPQLPHLAVLCSEWYSLKIAGLIFVGLSALVFAVQLIDLLQVLLIRSRIFSATTKLDIYGLSPVIYALNIVIYGFITGLYKGIYVLHWGMYLIFLSEVVLILFAVVALILERGEHKLGVQEPLLLPSGGKEEVQS